MPMKLPIAGLIVSGTLLLATTARLQTYNTYSDGNGGYTVDPDDGTPPTHYYPDGNGDFITDGPNGVTTIDPNRNGGQAIQGPPPQPHDPYQDQGHYDEGGQPGGDN
jgi:hypothetical protein